MVGGGYIDNQKKKNSESSLQFKSIINNRYLRTKIFNHVNHIHQAIVDRYFIGRKHQKGLTLIVKISQVISLQEFIRINRSDLFIDHFDRVYDTIKLGCKDDNVILDHDIVFRDLLGVIIDNNDSISLEFMLNRFSFTLQTIIIWLPFSNNFLPTLTSTSTSTTTTTITIDRKEYL
ncbi:hypothetical protein DFA_10134 [Cavenderia fasciculata]|uniref:Uncharacterized protein n=1 Tax=Cavenderia fasciculata TaxID=261658 RepID=F4Q9D1_CACFS|nr:uncharacterized protein DFA_10134 [Cavenderia fasciculata]EGG15300.1 hypothetical protein DFA_10134 [Cavenderia fasciculata]|eukprot:XP_004352020.1 hypothetical protein DFA_10134 [Cavenderia fasciculata]